MAKKEVTLSGRQMQELFERERFKLDELRRRQQLVQNAQLEVLTAIKALEDIQAAEEKEKILVSLGAGFFAEAALENKESVKSILAGRVMHSQSIAQALKELKERKEEFTASLKDLAEEQNKVRQNISNLGRVISTAQRAVREKRQEEKEKKK